MQYLYNRYYITVNILTINGRPIMKHFQLLGYAVVVSSSLSTFGFQATASLAQTEFLKPPITVSSPR